MMTVDSTLLTLGAVLLTSAIIVGLIRLGFYLEYKLRDRNCEHEPGRWFMREARMGKIRFCRKCGKCVGLI
jgi:hypothetical protein